MSPSLQIHANKMTERKARKLLLFAIFRDWSEGVFFALSHLELKSLARFFKSDSEQGADNIQTLSDPQQIYALLDVVLFSCITTKAQLTATTITSPDTDVRCRIYSTFFLILYSTEMFFRYINIFCSKVIN
jgi:hypothetical protein